MRYQKPLLPYLGVALCTLCVFLLASTASAVVHQAVTYTIASGQSAYVDGHLTSPFDIDNHTNINVTGTIPSELWANFNPSTHAASLTDSGCGLNFLQQTPGTIAFSNGSLTYTFLVFFSDTITWNNLHATLLTPSPPGTVTGSSSPYSADMTQHQVSVNEGTVSDSAGLISTYDFTNPTYSVPHTAPPGTASVYLSAAGTPYGISISSSTGYHETCDYTTSLSVPIVYTETVSSGSDGGTITIHGNGTNNTINTNTMTFSHTFNYLPGDINLDGSVNVNDLAVLAAHYRQTVTGTQAQRWAQGDFTNDGAVNISDLAILAAHYRMTGSDLSLDQAEAMYGLPLTAPVPEPSSLVMLTTLVGLLGAWWTSRRRNRIT